MTHDLEDTASGPTEPPPQRSGDELDRLRLALLHERSRADAAERELAELRATLEDAPVVEPGEPAVVPEPPAAGRPRRLRRRR